MKTFSHQAFTKIPRALRWFTFAAIALLAGGAQAQIPVFTNVWSITNLTHSDLPASGNSVRGIAISPVTSNVVYASTLGGSHFSTLDYNAGTNRLGVSSGTGISGGTLALTQIRVSDDGFVYACNLSGASNSTFKIYRWPSETNFTDAPIVVFHSTNYVYNPPGTNSFQYRVGDYIDLRGSGAATEIIVAGNGIGGPVSTNVVLFRATDAEATNFTAIPITMPSPVAIPPGTNVAGGGVTFEGTNDVIYIKRPGLTTVTRVAYDPIGMTSTNMSSFTMDQGNNNGMDYFETNGVKLIATISTANGTSTNSTTHFAKVLQLNTPSNAVVVFLAPLPLPVIANGNVLGLVDAKNGHVVFSEPNNSIALFNLSGFVTNVAPTVTGNGTSGTVLEGYPFTFTGSAGGTAPLSYQWHFNTNTPIGGATTNSYAIAAAHITNGGTYTLVVTNPYGSATSSVATLTVLPLGYTAYATQLWTLAPGSRDYLTGGDAQRGLAFDPVLNRLILVSRSSTNGIHILDAADGADLGEMDIAPILPPNTPPAPPGQFAINMCGVADDGAVYVGNLLTTTNPISDNFTIYRWNGATNSDLMGQAYLGNPGVERLGDTMAVRGAGTNTQILCSFRFGTNIAIFTTLDGTSFNINVIPVTGLSNNAAGLGVAWGAGDTCWVKSAGFDLRQVSFDLNTLTATVLTNYPLPGAESVIGVDNLNGFLATIGTVVNPQNLALYDLFAAGGPALTTLLDRELFSTNAVNGNGTGSIAVDAANQRIFALDSNNGIIALSYSLYTLSIAPTPSGGIVTWPGTGNLLSSTNVAGPYADVVGATTPHTNTVENQIYFRVRR